MKTKTYPYTKSQLFWLVALRWLIGWHFLYEGIVKLMNPKWTSFPYLMDSKGFLESFFHFLAENKTVLPIVNSLNEWGLLLIGIGLIVGCFTRIATIAGIMLLTFYYLSHIPFIGSSYLLPTEGSYLWVDKNLIEIAALAVLFVFPTSRIFGLDGCIFKKTKNNK